LSRNQQYLSTFSLKRSQFSSSYVDRSYLWL